MTAELATSFSSFTTGAKNILDISNSLLLSRRRNKMITKAEMDWLRIAIEQQVAAARVAARHGLMMDMQDKLWETYQRIQERDVNRPFGMVSLQLMRDEAEAYATYLKNFDRITGFLA